MHAWVGMRGCVVRKEFQFMKYSAYDHDVLGFCDVQKLSSNSHQQKTPLTSFLLQLSHVKGQRTCDISIIVNFQSVHHDEYLNPHQTLKNLKNWMLYLMFPIDFSVHSTKQHSQSAWSSIHVDQKQDLSIFTHHHCPLLKIFHYKCLLNVERSTYNK